MQHSGEYNMYRLETGEWFLYSVRSLSTKYIIKKQNKVSLHSSKTFCIWMTGNQLYIWGLEETELKLFYNIIKKQTQWVKVWLFRSFSSVMQMLRLFRYHILRTSTFTQILMGIIVFSQSQFLKFSIEDSGASGGACLIAAAIEAVILVAIIIYERKQESDSVSR